MMSKNSSVAFLVKAIIEEDPGMIRVKDSALVSYYVSNSRYMIELDLEDKKFNIFTEHTGDIEDDFENLGEMQRAFAKELGANYLFTSYLYPPSARLTAVATPFMILSENEIDFLVKKYYKDVPEGISRAAYELGIKLYEKEYRNYSNLESSGELDHLILNMKDDNQISDFFSIVFSLPYEEQNITANKAIFRSYIRYFDFEEVLVRDYSKGEYFQEYFESLSHNIKSMVASRIESLEQRNLNNDVFLLKERFFVKGVNLIELYKNDTESFIKYFEGGLNLESQKFLIEEIYKESFINQEVVEWLEKNYAHLLREVGFTGGN